MLSAIKDLVSAVALFTVFAFANGQSSWLDFKLSELRREVIQLSKTDWGCPSIFSKKACRP